MWWLLIPVAGYVGKKIIDAVSEDNSSSSSSSNSYSKLLLQKNKRRAIRETALNQLMSKHRSRIKNKLTDVIENEFFYVGKVALDSSNDTTYKVVFTDLDKAISCLSMANNIFSGKSIIVSNSISSYTITLKSNSSLIDEIVQKADLDYGSLAGIDLSDDYVESKDQFLDRLKKVST